MSPPSRRIGPIGLPAFLLQHHAAEFDLNGSEDYLVDVSEVVKRRIAGSPLRYDVGHRIPRLPCLVKRKTALRGPSLAGPVRRRGPVRYPLVNSKRMKRAQLVLLCPPMSIPMAFLALNDGWFSNHETPCTGEGSDCKGGPL
jgi:hypothetical protein